jgi:pentatricopeptide repeat protein
VWNSILQAYSAIGKWQEPLQLFEEMIQAGITPSEVTYSIILKTAAEMTNLQMGQRIRERIEVYYNHVFLYYKYNRDNMQVMFQKQSLIH